ncbi:MAG: MHS family MFS transporter [Alphaproteobacteria bacterium]|nr:MHS family MFS transporter [Alphaproteobacteria bacterium]
MSLVFSFPRLSSKASKNLMLGCFVGNALEWFDFAIYGYLAGILAQLFFPNFDTYTALLSSYGVFAAAFLMRPIGAILFGHFGDKWGRKKALLWSLAGMAVPTVIMGVLPVYNDIGIFAPFSLIICRLIQGLSLGGEFSGSVLLLTEHAPPQRKGFYSIWADMGSSIGMIAASLAILLLNSFLTLDELLSWGWRLPFLTSFCFAIGGYFLRRHLTETPEFLAQDKKRPSSWPLSIIFQKYKWRLTLAICFLMVNSAGYYLLIVFIPNHNLNNYSKIYGSATTLFSLIIMMPAMVWGALVSDKIGQVRCLIMGYLGCLIFAYPLLYSAKYGTFFEHLICQGLFATSLGFCFGPRCSFATQLFPTSIRYSAVGLSYNIGNAIFGGTAPLICGLMIEQTGTIMAPAIYIIGASLLSIISVILLDRDLSYAQNVAPKGFLDQTHTPDYRIHMLHGSPHPQSSLGYLRKKKF